MAMEISKFDLNLNGAGTGLRLQYDGEYLLSYTNLQDCVTDLIYHFSVRELNHIFSCFSAVDKVIKPYKYRGVCSELFEPTNTVNRYVAYSDTVGGLLAEFEKHELRAVKDPEIFTFGVQGTGIHLFDAEENKYKLWLGGEFSSVADIIRTAKAENKIVPDELVEEISKLNQVDVFISHKSEDFALAKKVYDVLIKGGYSVFLSEISLPALSNADYSFEIDSALEKAKNLIVIATKAEHILSGWVKYEWTSFANEKRSGRKEGNLVTLADGINLDSLPYLLRQYEVISVNDLDKIKDFLIS